MAAQSTGFAIKRANNDVIFFDAITQLSESYRATITKHPLSNGSLITDHTTLDNPTFSISGVLSDADFNYNRPTINGTDINTSKQYINDTVTVYPVQISERSTINKILPEVVAQFTRETIPEVYVTPQDKAKTARAVKIELTQMMKEREEFTFFEFNDGVIPTTYSNCVMTGLNFEENPDTGDGVFPNIQFEQVRYSTVKNVSIKVNKGRKTGKTTTVKGKSNPAANATSYSKETASSVLDYKNTLN